MAKGRATTTCPISTSTSAATPPRFDPKTATKIETADGGVVVYIGRPRRKKEDVSFNDNLADDLDDSVLGGIADELLERINEDDQSRREWLETRARGIELMGLKIEAMRANGSDGFGAARGPEPGPRHPARRSRGPLRGQRLRRALARPMGPPRSPKTPAAPIQISTTSPTRWKKTSITT